MTSAARPSPPPHPAPAGIPPPSSKQIDLEITMVSAKHLKNVNWRHGNLKPYAVAYLDREDRRAATKPDDAGSTRPVWNERFTLPIPSSYPTLGDAVLTIDIFHSKPSETPKPLVGTARSQLKDLIDLDQGGDCGPLPIRTLELHRPSGRPQGKVRIKINLLERPTPPPPPSQPEYHMPPPLPPSRCYYSNPPPPTSHPPTSAREYRSYSPPLPPPQHHYSNLISPPPAPQYQYGGYSDPYSGYYSSNAAGGYYSAPPAPARMMQQMPTVYDRTAGYGGPIGPSAPLDYSSGSSTYEQKSRGSRMGLGAGLGTGLAVGAVAGALGGLALEEGIKYEEQKITDRVESDLAPRDDYSDYRADY